MVIELSVVSVRMSCCTGCGINNPEFVVNVALVLSSVAAYEIENVLVMVICHGSKALYIESVGRIKQSCRESRRYCKLAVSNICCCPLEQVCSGVCCIVYRIEIAVVVNSKCTKCCRCGCCVKGRMINCNVSNLSDVTVYIVNCVKSVAYFID